MKSKITITLPMAMLALALASFSCAGLTITQNQYSFPTTSDTAKVIQEHLDLAKETQSKLK